MSLLSDRHCLLEFIHHGSIQCMDKANSHAARAAGHYRCSLSDCWCQANLCTSRRGNSQAHVTRFIIEFGQHSGPAQYGGSLVTVVPWCHFDYDGCDGDDDACDSRATMASNAATRVTSKQAVMMCTLLAWTQSQASTADCAQSGHVQHAAPHIAGHCWRICACMQ
jgi:hypothetical protein